VKFGEETSTANLPPSDMSLNNASNRAVTSRSTRSVPSTRSNNSTSRNNDSPNRAINQAIEKLKQDREQYLGQMGVNTTQNGFEVTDQTPPALRARLGLKPGDKIVSSGVNEAQLLEQVRQAGQAKIEIQRGDQTMTIQQSF
jgi:general secretion pathway protein C